jgi:hypothetical protein
MENANPLVNRRQLMFAGSLAASAAAGASFDPAHKPAIGNLGLTMELNKPLSLPAVLGTETSAAEYENHRVLSCSPESLRRFAAGRKARSWNHVGSHLKPSII